MGTLTQWSFSIDRRLCKNARFARDQITIIFITFYYYSCFTHRDKVIFYYYLVALNCPSWIFYQYWGIFYESENITNPYTSKLSWISKRQSWWTNGLKHTNRYIFETLRERSLTITVSHTDQWNKITLFLVRFNFSAIMSLPPSTLFFLHSPLY